MDDVALVVDAANVVGSRPDGWWRDRAGAAARLVDRIAGALRSGSLDAPVAVILEGAAKAAAPAGAAGAEGLRVVHAARDGDSAIVAEVASLVALGEPVTVVTADRGLRARVVTQGGSVVGPSWLLDRFS
jgi:hypothetical protein